MAVTLGRKARQSSILAVLVAVFTLSTFFMALVPSFAGHGVATPYVGNLGCPPGYQEIKFEYSDRARSNQVPTTVGGTYSLTGTGGVSIMITTTAVKGSGTNQDPYEATQFNWSMTAGSTYTAGIDFVFVKAGDGGIQYTYVPEATSDTGLNGGTNIGISHISFCYDQDLTTTTTAGPTTTTAPVVPTTQPQPPPPTTVPPTTTTAPVTTTTVPSTTTTIPDQVLPTLITRPAGPDRDNDDDDDEVAVKDEDRVLGKVVHPAAPEVLPLAAPGVLPLTGGDPTALMGLAGMLLSTGGGLVLASRKKR
jgi:LPXTG-motif cell wall-anchored protein